MTEPSELDIERSFESPRGDEARKSAEGDAVGSIPWTTLDTTACADLAGIGKLPEKISWTQLHKFAEAVVERLNDAPGQRAVATSLSVDEANTAVAVARTKAEKLAAFQALAAASAAEVQRLATDGVPGRVEGKAE